MVVRSPLTTQLLKRLTPLLAAPAALLLPGRADAILTYNIFESGGNVVIETTGSLSVLGNPSGFANCNIPGRGSFIGFLNSSSAGVCAGPNAFVNLFPITGPTSFNGTVDAIASSSSGLTTALGGQVGVFGILPTYALGSPIVSTTTFNSATLASLGFTTTALLGTWQIGNQAAGFDSIEVVIGEPIPIPGPLPVLGAAAAFGWSRRLRRRIATAKTPAAG